MYLKSLGSVHPYALIMSQVVVLAGFKVTLELWNGKCVNAHAPSLFQRSKMHRRY